MVAVDLLDNVAKLAVEGRDASVARLDHVRAASHVLPFAVNEEVLCDQDGLPWACEVLSAHERPDINGVDGR